MNKKEMEQFYTIMLKRGGMIVQETRWNNVVDVKVEWPDTKTNRWYRAFFKFEPKRKWFEDPNRR
jgi:hypothetical protein